MIGFARRFALRDPQAGVPFRPWMLVLAGSISEIAPHRIVRLAPADKEKRGGLLPWTLAMAGLMAAFLLGSSWSALPEPPASGVCRLAAPDSPAHASAQPRER